MPGIIDARRKQVRHGAANRLPILQAGGAMLEVSPRQGVTSPADRRNTSSKRDIIRYGIFLYDAAAGGEMSAGNVDNTYNARAPRSAMQYAGRAAAAARKAAR